MKGDKIEKKCFIILPTLTSHQNALQIPDRAKPYKHLFLLEIARREELNVTDILISLDLTSNRERSPEMSR